jgi:hypothetical protein
MRSETTKNRQGEQMTITFTAHELNALKTLVEYAALNTGDGANAENETIEILLWTINNPSNRTHQIGTLAGFVKTAREALNAKPNKGNK